MILAKRKNTTSFSGRMTYHLSKSWALFIFKETTALFYFSSIIAFSLRRSPLSVLSVFFCHWYDSAPSMFLVQYPLIYFHNTYTWSSWYFVRLRKIHEKVYLLKKLWGSYIWIVYKCHRTNLLFFLTMMKNDKEKESLFELSWVFYKQSFYNLFLLNKRLGATWKVDMID